MNYSDVFSLSSKILKHIEVLELSSSLQTFLAAFIFSVSAGLRSWTNKRSRFQEKINDIMNVCRGNI
jgi:hypothetical protein